MNVCIVRKTKKRKIHENNYFTCKGSKIRNFDALEPSPIMFPEVTHEIKAVLKSFSKNDLIKIMKIKNQLLEDVYKTIHEPRDQALAINLYSGLVFKEINIHSYDPPQIHYLENHLCILSALYGVLKPSTGIEPYRLDFTMTKLGIDLYDLWKDVLNQYFKNETIVNLASLEFSRLLDLPMLNIHFKEEQSDGTLKVITVRAKKARGLMVDYMVSHTISDLNHLKIFNEMGYAFSNDLSTDWDWVFLLKYD